MDFEPGGRSMVGADSSTEVWRPPKMVVFIKRKIPKNTKNGGFYKEKKYLKPKC